MFYVFQRDRNVVARATESGWSTWYSRDAEFRYSWTVRYLTLYIIMMLLLFFYFDFITLLLFLGRVYL